MNKRIYLLTALIILLIGGGCSRNATLRERETDSSSAHSKYSVEKPRILYINSYNPEFPWARGILRGIFSVYDLSWDDSGEIKSDQSPVTLRVHHMRTLLDQSPEHMAYAVKEARHVIDEWKPDVVIASDDNASRFLIAPHYRGGSQPFVFCGVNWDASEYGFPADNVTGMIEVSQAGKVIEELRPYARGNRVAYLRANAYTTRKEVRFFEKTLPYPVDARLVGSFKEWKREFIALQEEADILVTTYPSAMADWNGDEVALKRFMMENTAIPTGGWDVWMSENVLLTIANIAEEQGEWAARTALEIARGKSPGEIPVEENKRGAYYLNMKLAKQLNIQFPLDLIQKSHMVNTLEDTKKIYYVNSYHRGYGWSDVIEDTLKKTLSRSELNYELKVFRMNTGYYHRKRRQFRRISGRSLSESRRDAGAFLRGQLGRLILLSPPFRSHRACRSGSYERNRGKT